MYKSDSSPRKETDKLKPWIKMATFKLKAEEVLQGIDGYVLSILIRNGSFWDDN